MTTTQKYNTAALNRAVQQAKLLYFRNMPWRELEFASDVLAYRTLVSEMMLQQTQVARVIPKFIAFMQTFPTITDLGNAPLAQVLTLWNGLGYNRRAKYLHEAAQTLQRVPQPWTIQRLQSCKGIGANTAAAVRVYAYSSPEVFIETNIRTVLLHYVFTSNHNVTDQQMLDVIKATIDISHTREWYWALMDEGARLKTQKSSHLKRAASYKKQPKFKGSNRELRGAVLKQLTNGPLELNELLKIINDERLQQVVAIMRQEGLLHVQNNFVRLGTAK